MSTAKHLRLHEKLGATSVAEIEALHTGQSGLEDALMCRSRQAKLPEVRRCGADQRVPERVPALG